MADEKKQPGDAQRERDNQQQRQRGTQQDPPR